MSRYEDRGSKYYAFALILAPIAVILAAILLVYAPLIMGIIVTGAFVLNWIGDKFK